MKSQIILQNLIRAYYCIKKNYFKCNNNNKQQNKVLGMDSQSSVCYQKDAFREQIIPITNVTKKI